MNSLKENNGIIFVAGIHGVGKTTCCEKASVRTGLPFHTASEIIRSEKSSAIEQNTKSVADVKGNQELLLIGIQRKLDLGQFKFFLDGHFTIKNARQEIEVIPVKVFESICIKGIVVYHDNPTDIL